MAVIKSKKGSKKASETINSRLALVVKSGKFSLGTSSVMKNLRGGKAKLVIIAKNTPPLRKAEIEYYSMLSKVGVHHFQGSNVDLGRAVGKTFRVGIMSIQEGGDSDILSEDVYLNLTGVGA